MASPRRTTPPAMTDQPVDDLLDHGNRYAFFQAMRLLRQRVSDDQALRDSVRVRPNLSLAFPDTDLQTVVRDTEGRYHIEANFFGLYGVTSPLPTFYTEDLIQEAMQGHSATRDFIDILHASLYPLLFRAWEKYRIWVAIGEQRDTQRLQQLYSLIGIAGAAEWEDDARELLPYAGNLSFFPRSALGLEGLLRGMLNGLTVRVEPCVTRAVSIPESALTLLGSQTSVLGETSLLGQQVRDCAGNLDIVIGPMSADHFHALLPGAQRHRRISRAILWYLPSPLRCELQLWLHPDERRCASLGQGWQRLGCNTWLGKGSNPSLAARPVRFPLMQSANKTQKTTSAKAVALTDYSFTGAI